MLIANLLVAFAFGAVIGSFLNVVIYRVPREKSIVFPPSACTECEHKLGVLDLIPILSYLFLAGKCRYCKTPISFRYPIVELLNAATWTLALYFYGPGVMFVKAIIFCSLLIAITFIDLEFMIIPDSMSLGGAVIGFIFAIAGGQWLWGIVGGLIGGGIIYAIFLLGLLLYRQETMGGGDVKMMLMVGTFLGGKSVAMAIFVAVFLGGFIGMFLIATKIKSRKDFIPFGPFLALGSLITLFFDDWLVSSYIKLIS